MKIIGKASDPAVLEDVATFLTAQGQTRDYARYLIRGDMIRFDPDDMYVIAIEDLPFLMGEGDLIPFACNSYRIYRDCYLPVIQQYGGQPVPGLFYPLLHETSASPEDVLRQNKSYRPHIIGAKSQVVQWQMVEDRREIGDVVTWMRDTFHDHVEDMQARWEVPEDDSELFRQGWDLFPVLDDRRGMMTAFHLPTGQVLAAMQVFLDGDVMDCASISVNKGEEWKPYGLTNAAQIATAHWGLANGFTEVNYGINPPGMGDYKAMFSRMEPVLGLTCRDLLLQLL